MVIQVSRNIMKTVLNTGKTKIKSNFNMVFKIIFFIVLQKHSKQKVKNMNYFFNNIYQ